MKVNNMLNFLSKIRKSKELINAIEREDIKKAEFLLAEGVSPIGKVCFFYKVESPLSVAIKKKAYDFVSLFVRFSGNVNLRDKTGIKPLSLACDQGDHVAAKLLIEKGAIIDSICLWDACRKNKLELVKLLIESGFPPNDYVMKYSFRYSMDVLNILIKHYDNPSASLLKHIEANS